MHIFTIVSLLHRLYLYVCLILLTRFQDRFFINSSVPQTDQLWHIPITFTTGNNPDWETLKPVKVMSEKNDTVERNGTGHEWVIFNVQQKGVFV